MAVCFCIPLLMCIVHPSDSSRDGTRNSRARMCTMIWSPAQVRRGGNFWISRVRGPLVQISTKSANLQQNLCNKPRGSGGQKDSLLLELNKRILYYGSRTNGFFTIGAEQKDSLLLEPNRRILYYWRRPEGFFTRILYYWRRTEGFFTIGAEQKDSLLLAPNRRILYSWNRTEGFLTIGAAQKDSLLVEPNRRIIYCWRRAEEFILCTMYHIPYHIPNTFLQLSIQRLQQCPRNVVVAKH